MGVVRKLLISVSNVMSWEKVEASTPARLRCLSRSSVKPLIDPVKPLTGLSIRDNARTAEVISSISYLQ